MKPNIKNHNPCPNYIRKLISKTGMTQKNAGLAIGITLSTLDNYLNKNSPSNIPYSAQYCFERLADLADIAD